MSTDFYHHADIKNSFAKNLLPGFNELWELDTPWFEEPNHRRNGWSGVIKQPFTYEGIDGTAEDGFIFVKRQENHNHKTLLNPIDGVPTFRREFHNIIRLREHKIPSLTALYYGERTVNGKKQAILVTRALDGYQSFEDYHLDPGNTDKELWVRILQRGGIVIRKLHDSRFRHNCLYPKHLFVKVDDDDDDVDVRLIDLEKLVRRPFSFLVRQNDLSRIIRRFDPLPDSDAGILIESYLTYGKDLSTSGLKTQLNAIMKHHHEVGSL